MTSPGSRFLVQTSRANSPLLQPHFLHTISGPTRDGRIMMLAASQWGHAAPRLDPHIVQEKYDPYASYTKFMKPWPFLHSTVESMLVPQITENP